MSIHLFDLVWLTASAALAGAINSVAGGGTFLVFPALIFAGLTPIAANATSTMAVWPGSVAAVAGYREELYATRTQLPPLLAMSVLGGFAGALILLLTPERFFEFLIPYLLLGATFLFACGKYIIAYVRLRFPSNHTFIRTRKWLSYLLQFVIALYGGYFGAGIGILMLALLQIMGLNHVHRMNGLKTLLGTCINGIAVITFIVAGVIVWNVALPMLLGAILGGYAGARLARRLPESWIRGFVILVGTLMTLHFFLK